jgi:DNA-binding transcriptional regulator YbjK
MSGKPGRPPEDRLKRQHEIYLAVAPLIERHGAKRLTMRQAARAAHLSLGGLYHYFPTKRDLVLHALKPEAVARVCAEFHGRHADLARTDPNATCRPTSTTWPASAFSSARRSRPLWSWTLRLPGTTSRSVSKVAWTHVRGR